MLVAPLARGPDWAQDGSTAGDKVESAEKLLVDLSPGLRYASLPAAERRRIEAPFGEQVADNIETRVIRRRDGARGLVVALVGEDRGDPDRVVSGFEDGGGNAALERIAGTEFLVGRDRASRHVAFRLNGNTVVFILAASGSDLRSFARPFADG